MAAKLTTKQFEKAVTDLTHGHTDLTVFHAVMALMESSLLYDPRSKDAAQGIVRICKAEAQRLLRKHDAGRSALSQHQGGTDEA